MELNDNSLMPFGAYKNKKLANVPADYLLYIYEQSWFLKTSPLGVYIKNNKKTLETEVKNSKR